MIVDKKSKLYQALMGLDIKPEGRVSVGIHSGEGAEGHKESEGLTIADIATAHEFGTDKLPERSFIRAWFDAKKPKLLEAIRKQLEIALREKDKRGFRIALKRIGLLFQADIQKWISEGNVSPELSQVTIDRKGHDVPLIEEGILKSSILGVVDDT